MQTQLHRSGLLRYNEMILSLKLTEADVQDLLVLLEQRSADKKYFSDEDVPSHLAELFVSEPIEGNPDRKALSPLLDPEHFHRFLLVLEKNYQNINDAILLYEQASSVEEFSMYMRKLKDHVRDDIAHATASVDFCHPFEDEVTLKFPPSSIKYDMHAKITLNGELAKFIGLHKAEGDIQIELYDSMIKFTYFSKVHYETQTYVYHA